VTADEAIAIVKQSNPPIVKWLDEDMRRHYGYILSVQEKRRVRIRGKSRVVPSARIRGKDNYVPLDDLSVYVKAEPDAPAA